jgi:hypothetical protein
MQTTRWARDLLVSMVAIIVAVPACSSSATSDADSAPLVVPDGCQPLLAEPTVPATSSCLAPYPSDFHRVADAASPTGFRLRLRGAARPHKANGAESDPHDIVATDGASILPAIVGALEGDVVREGLPGVLDDPTKSARADSATVLVEASTGALVAHYTDVFDRRDGTHTPIVLRPFAPLKPRTRYVVAITGAKKTPEGNASGSPTLATPPTGFRRLRDKVRDPALAAIAPRFEAEVLAPLERLGIARDRMQLAWDFTTGSAEQPIADMLRVRELTLAWRTANVSDVRVTETRAGKDGISKVLTLEVTAPLFLDKAGPGGRLFRDAAGQVAQNGTTTFPMLVVVPDAVASRAAPGRALAYGHGFFGGFPELEGNGATTIANSLGAVLFGLQWWGMSKDDLPLVAEALSQNPEHIGDFGERVHQAMANWLVATNAIRGPLTKLAELHRGAAADQPLLYDPSFVGYFGASQGHILGGTLAALNPDFSRVVLNVGGGAFTTIMPRSANFGPFALLLNASYSDALMAQSFIAMFARPLDRIDPIVYARHVLTEPLPGSPPDRRVLMQIGLGDAQVPNISSFVHARALGIAQLLPATVNVWGLPPADASTPSSLALYDFGIDKNLYADPHPLEPNAVHEGVRINAKALKQMDMFLAPNGVITHTCDGPCDPE